MPGKLVSRMSKRECFTLKETDTIKIASQLLSEKKIGCMPVINKNKNVIGMMPHPERCVEDILGGTDGSGIFQSLLN